MRCWFYFCSIKGFFYRQEWQPGVLLQVTGSGLHRGNLISYQGPRPFLFLNCKAFLLSTTDPFVALMTILFFSVLFCRDSETSFSTRMKLLQHWNQFFSNSVLCMDCLPWRHISPLFTKVMQSPEKNCPFVSDVPQMRLTLTSDWSDNLNAFHKIWTKHITATLVFICSFLIEKKTLHMLPTNEE